MRQYPNKEVTWVIRDAPLCEELGYGLAEWTVKRFKERGVNVIEGEVTKLTAKGEHSEEDLYTQRLPVG